MPASDLRNLLGSRSPLVVCLFLALLLAACGAGSPEPSPQAAASPAPEVADTAFPVTINHKHGSTEIREAPQRVVSVGLNDHDAILALGVKPVAVRDWFGDQPFATWPWAQNELGDAQPVVLSLGDLDFEQIAGLHPDLIIGTYSGLTNEEYTKLSQIAPAVAQSGDYPDYGVPWDEQTLIIGRAIGREDRAKELVADVEAQFAEAREAHPAFKGATAIVGLVRDDGSYNLYGSHDHRARILTSLGFERPAWIDEQAGDSYSANVSVEQAHRLDADVLILLVDEQRHSALANDPLYQKVNVVNDGRDILLDVNGTLSGAYSLSTVLSLPYLLDELVPQLAAAVNGDLVIETSPGS